MSCKDIKMNLLSEEEARKLFLDKLEYDVFNIPNLKPMAEEVLERCAQLPLAIVTIAASFKPLINDYEWRDALKELVMRTNNSDEPVFETLKFSYDRLRSDQLKQCLLHCALFPEDYGINKEELIEHLIDEGIIERMKNRQEEFDRGYAILSRLENACLLEGGNDPDDGLFVKMHDLVRDMVLLVASPEFMVGHLGLEDFSDDEKWSKDLVKASLMTNDISRIPSNVSPMCPNLSTLLLQCNGSLENVPDSFFVHLPGLKVLDLSHTIIESLPNSIFNLENLTTLRLSHCAVLERVPSLAKLTALRKLDLNYTGITEVPDGLEMLVNLRFLGLNAWGLEVVPLGILAKLSHLQYLIVYSRATTVNEEEIASLKELENFAGVFDDMDKFSTYIRSLELENRRLVTYQILVGPHCIRTIRGHEKEVILERECKLRRGDESLLLPKDVQYLEIRECDNLTSLCDVPSLKHASELQHIYLWECKIEHVLSFSSSSCSFPLLQTLEKLELKELDNLRILFRKENAASACVPSDTFSRLKVIDLFISKKIKKLLPPWLLVHLVNLEEIRVLHCQQLEEIIGEVSDEFEEEEKEEEGVDATEITLPKLRVLYLCNLPELKTICSNSKVIVCDSLEEIVIDRCRKLNRIPLSLPLLSNGQLSPPPSLQKIYADKEWWESLEWDCPNTKNVLQPFFFHRNYY